MNLDTLSPAYVGEDRIALSVDPVATPAPTIGKLLQVLVDYAKCLPAGVSLPLDFIVQGPTGSSFVSRSYRLRAPSVLAFIPIEAGLHQVILREHAHNRWVGLLEVNVLGDVREV